MSKRQSVKRPHPVTGKDSNMLASNEDSSCSEVDKIAKEMEDLKARLDVLEKQKKVAEELAKQKELASTSLDSDEQPSSTGKQQNPKSTSTRRTSGSPRSRKQSNSHSTREQQPVASGIVARDPSATDSSVCLKTPKNNSSPGASQSLVDSSKHREDCGDSGIKKKKTVRTKKSSQISHEEDLGPLVPTNTMISMPESVDTKKSAPAMSSANQSLSSKHGKDKNSGVREKAASKRSLRKRSQSSHGDCSSSEDIPLAIVLEVKSATGSSSCTSTTQSPNRKREKDSGNDRLKEKTSSKSKVKKRSQPSLQDVSPLKDHTSLTHVISANLPPASVSESLGAKKSAPDTSVFINQSPNLGHGKHGNSVGLKEDIATMCSQSSVEENQDSSLEPANKSICGSQEEECETKKTGSKRKMKDLSSGSHEEDLKAGSNEVSPPRKRKSFSLLDSPKKQSTSTHDDPIPPENSQSILPCSDVPESCSDVNTAARTPPFLILTRLSTEDMHRISPCKEKSEDLTAISSPISTKKQVKKKLDILSKPMPKSCKMMLEKTLVKASGEVDPPQKPFNENIGFAVPTVPVLKPKISKLLKPTNVTSLSSKRKTETNVSIKLKGKPSCLKSSTSVHSGPGDVAEPSVPSDMFQNFHKPKAQIEPLMKLQIENEELDFEPSTNDDDDLLSIYADSTIFQIGECRGLEETAPSTVTAAVNDTCDVDSVASYGSDDSRRLSDMEDDSDDEGNFKRKGTVPENYESGVNTEILAPIEVGFPVEDYAADSMGRNIRGSEVHVIVDRDTDHSCVSMSIESTYGSPIVEIQQFCPEHTADFEDDGTNTDESQPSEIEPSLISGGCAVSQSIMVNDELSPTSGTAGLGATVQETVSNDILPSVNESSNIEPGQENETDEPNLPATAVETAEHSSEDAEQIVVPDYFVPADRQSCDSDGDEKMTPDHEPNTDVVFEKQKEMCQREMEEDIRLISEVPTYPAGVHFPSPKRVYPDLERRALLPTPDATSVRQCTSENVTRGNLPPPDHRSSQHLNRGRPPLLPDPSNRPLQPVNHERRENLTAMAPQLLRNPSHKPTWPSDYEGGRNFNAPPLLCDPTDGPLRPFSTMPSSLDEASPILIGTKHKNVERLQPSHRIYQRNPCPISTKFTDNSGLRSPEEAQLKVQSQFDHFAQSVKDTDLRPRNVDLPRNTRSMSSGDVGFVDISHHCSKYLATGKCLDERICNSLHKLPTVKCVEIRHKPAIAELVKQMLNKFEFWMNESFSGIVKELGSSDEKPTIMSICKHLLERDIRLQDKTKLSKYAHQWELAAHALCDCGLSPAKAVRQIVCNVLNSQNPNYDVIDNVVEALYDKFIKGQKKLWSALQRLAKMEGYEMPAHILIEILKDAKNYREPQEHGELCEYLLRVPSPRLLDPKPEDSTDNEIRKLIHEFIHIYRSEDKEAAGKLAEYLKLNVSDECCRSDCVNAQNQFRSGVRFHLQQTVPKYERRSDYLSPRNSVRNVDKGSPHNVHFKSIATEIPSPKAQLSESKASAQEEEVTSSTGEVTCLPAAQANQVLEGGPVVHNTPGNTSALVSGSVPQPAVTTCSVLPAKKGNQKMTFEPIHITLKGPDRVLLCSSSKLPSDLPEVPSQNPTSKSESLDGMDSCSSSKPPSELPEASSQKSTNKSENLVARDNATSKLPNQSQNISQMIARKHFAKAANAIAGWGKFKDILNPGIHAIVVSLLHFQSEDAINNFKILLQAVCAHTHGTGTSPKSVMAEVGFQLIAHFLKVDLYKEADKIHSILREKVNFNEVEVNLSQAGVKLLSSWVHLQNKNIKEVLKIVTDNNFTSFPDNWKCHSDPDDHGSRDLLCCALLDQCREMDSFLPQVDLLFRSMLNAKDSYSFDVGGQLLDNIVCSFARAGLGKDALNLMLWTSREHNLMPKNDVSKRLLLTQINVLRGEDQLNYSPHMLCLLQEEPYKEALPESVEGLPKVHVKLQSIWFACEVRSILLFLLHCHLCNLPPVQQMPEVTVIIKVVSLPPVRTEKDFPRGLRAVDPSLSAMEERVRGVLRDPNHQLISAEARFKNGSIDLDRELVEKFVAERRRHCQRNDPSHTSHTGYPHQVDQASVNQDDYPNQANQAFVDQDDYPNQAFVDQDNYPNQVFVGEDNYPNQVNQAFVNQDNYPNQASQAYVNQDSYPDQGSQSFVNQDTYLNQASQAFVYEGVYYNQAADSWAGEPHGGMFNHAKPVGNWQQPPFSNAGGYDNYGGFRHQGAHMPLRGPQDSRYEQVHQHEHRPRYWPGQKFAPGRSRGRGKKFNRQGYQ